MAMTKEELTILKDIITLIRDTRASIVGFSSPYHSKLLDSVEGKVNQMIKGQSE
jgi:hypothetical protein